MNAALFLQIVWTMPKLYRLPLTGGEAVKIGDMVPETFVVYKKDIWITTEGRLYYASTENALLQEILSNGAENISVLDQGANYIYYQIREQRLCNHT